MTYVEWELLNQPGQVGDRFSKIRTHVQLFLRRDTEFLKNAAKKIVKMDKTKALPTDVLPAERYIEALVPLEWAMRAALTKLLDDGKPIGMKLLPEAVRPEPVASDATEQTNQDSHGHGPLVALGPRCHGPT